MAGYQGDYDVGANVFIWFNTFDSNDPSVSTQISDFIDTDVHIFKDDGLTQRANAAGVEVDVDVDTYTGVNKITIHTADNTVNDFFEAGHDYSVVIVGTAVDAGVVNACVGTFSIANRRVAGHMCSSSIDTLASQTSFTLVNGEASADADAYNGCIIIVTDQVTKIQKAIGLISNYEAAETVTLAADPAIFTMAVGDSVEIIATSALANVKAVNGTLQTANDNGADVNAILTDTAEIGAGVAMDGGTATIAGMLTKIADDNGGATFDAGEDSLNKIRDDRTLAAADYTVVGDTMAAVTVVNGLAANVITAASIATGAITADALHADAIDLIWDEIIEGTLSGREGMQLLLAHHTSKSSGGGTAELTYRNVSDDADALVFTVDSAGNRSGVVRSPA